MSQEDQRNMKSEQNKHWLNNNVNQILEPMMLAVVQEAPNDKVSEPPPFGIGARVSLSTGMPDAQDYKH